MWPESGEHQQPLRTGLTTGCCATACCVAAAELLLNPGSVASDSLRVSVTLPRGKTVELDVIELGLLEQGNLDKAGQGAAFAATIKDAGDDPDVTHGAKVFVELTLRAQPGIEFVAGPGVGTVTRDGLVLAVGEAAINPVPRKMMIQHLEDIASNYKYQAGFRVSVGVEKGEQLALKTMNPRLGIVGGLSILGTTGIVRPFSCAAYIASIHQGIDVAKANGFDHIAATTGSTSEATIRSIYSLPEMALIEMGDFVGAVLKYLKKQPVKKLSICGGFGKISKLANGHLDLHSRASSIDLEHLAGLAESIGADKALVERIIAANTSIEAYRLCEEEGLNLAQPVCEAAFAKARGIVPSGVELEVLATDRQGKVLGRTSE
ncbi:cobalt-precorrin-5B (C(1))-methyltransferase [Maricurvus nonylphenolicus]|uniref:cobalt-precorrin-5B (C(1))-methyltransferase n=1 Tax=Maricurvus nonylphenolicus TaxID=1008307 RepID=UPI0036F19491